MNYFTVNVKGWTNSKWGFPVYSIENHSTFIIRLNLPNTLKLYNTVLAIVTYHFVHTRSSCDYWHMEGLLLYESASSAKNFILDATLFSLDLLLNQLKQTCTYCRANSEITNYSRIPNIMSTKIFLRKDSYLPKSEYK